MGPEDPDPEDYETLPHSAPFTIQLAAGSLAGVAEHSIMYPFDCVKTRLQTGASGIPIVHKCSVHHGVPLLPHKLKVKTNHGSFKVSSESLVSILMRMWRFEGPRALTRGLSAAAAGAAPAHAFYYTTYERTKTFFHNKIRSNNPLAAPLSQALAGCCATAVHDAVMNPAEVVKQRMQLPQCSQEYSKNQKLPPLASKRQHHLPKTGPTPNYEQVRLNHYKPSTGNYSSSADCAIQTLRNEGLVAFYRSYPTQLTMNIPFQASHFVIYEATLKWLNPTKEYNPVYHSISGAVGGAAAAAVTTPLDACKTVLNTQMCVRLHPELLSKGQIVNNVPGFRAAARALYDCFGIRGFFRGATARMVIQAPSTAISWTVYEFFKHHLMPAPTCNDH